MRLLLVVATGVAAASAPCGAAVAAHGSHGSTSGPAARPHVRATHAPAAARWRPHGTVVILGHTAGAAAESLLGPHTRSGDRLSPAPKPALH